MITVIGLITTAWGVGRGFGTNIAAETMAADLRNALAKMSSQVAQAYQNNQISGYEREVALQRINLLTSVFNQYADIIEYKGLEGLTDALAQDIFEGIVALSPGEQVGKVVGLLTYGKGLDQIVSIGCIANSIENSDVFAASFSEQQEGLRNLINQIFGIDADALFKARMRAKINFLRQEWIDKIEDYPCQPDHAMQDYRTWAYVRARIWAEVPRLYGEGEKWSTYDDFLDWMIAEARGEGGEKIVQTWEGDFSLNISPVASCFACVPPSVSGTLQLTVNLETCAVQGKLSGEGEGNVTIKDCDSDGNILEETCTSHGTLSILGNITGKAVPSGALSLDPATMTFTGSHAWVEGCDWASRAVSQETWEDPITITGSLDWKVGGNGKISYLTDACNFEGEFTVKKK